MIYPVRATGPDTLNYKKFNYLENVMRRSMVQLPFKTFNN